MPGQPGVCLDVRRACGGAVISPGGNVAGICVLLSEAGFAGGCGAERGERRRGRRVDAPGRWIAVDVPKKRTAAGREPGSARHRNTKEEL